MAVGPKCHCPIVLSLIVLVFISHICLGKSNRHHDVPHLSYTEDDISIQTGTILQITCYSKSHIEWLYPNTSDMNMRVRFDTSIQINTDNEKEFTSTLTVNSTKYTDTGLYQCVLQNSMDRINNQTAASIYVFVNSEDADELILPHAVISVQAFADWLFIIPCRVSNKDSVVSLDVEDEDGVHYDPERGFIIEKNQANFAGFIQCTATLNGQSDSYSFIVHYQGNAPVPAPMIKGSHTEVVKGDHFTVTCTVDSPLRSIMQFTWNYPGKGISDSRVTITQDSEERREATRTFRRFYGYLVVTNVELSDDGEYECTAENYIGSTTVSKNVVVLETGYIEIYPLKNQYLLEAEINSKAKISFMTKANPRATYTWYKDGVPIYKNNTEYSIRRLSEQRRLIIHNVNLDHQGDYTLIGINDYVTQDNTVRLAVIEKPKITITQDPGPSRKTSPPLYNIDSSYILDCKATGRPEPTVSWYWQQCTQSDDCKHAFPDVNHWDRITEIASDNAHYVEDTKVHVTTATVPGWYRCVASSSSFVNNVTKDIEFKLTDVKDGLVVESATNRAKKKKVPTATLR